MCYTRHMRAFVRLKDPDGVVHELSHGDIIGRVWSAALHLDDARISEAHAMVSLRGQELKLLALRGMFALGRKTLRELVLDRLPRLRPETVALIRTLEERGVTVRIVDRGTSWRVYRR